MSLLTNKEVQKKYNISRTTLFRLEKKGLPFINVGRNKRYDESILEQWFDNESKDIKQLEIGKTYDNLTISKVFGCGMQGGIRKSQTTNTLVIFLNHTNALYEDIWIDNNIILYKGITQSKENLLGNNLNKALYESKQNGVSVHLFESFICGEYLYRGQVELINTPELSVKEEQLSENTKIYIFPLRLKINKPVKIELIEHAADLQNEQIRMMADDELKRKAECLRKGGFREVIVKKYLSNPFVSQYTLRRSNGICDLCNSKAQFVDKNNQPYLEVHHVKPLSENGLDSIDNCVALCPTCHRKLHILNLKEDKDKLLKKLDEYKEIKKINP